MPGRKACIMKARWNHFKKIIIHKYWVLHYCNMCGLYKQGLIHDLSKFSPTEFEESIKYYCGTDSPINKCKEINGYSMAWFHHRGRNKHHYEYWTDNYDSGTTAVKMPFKYMLEMVCDYLAAGRAYSGDKFTMEKEYEWWQQKKKIAFMHKRTKMMIEFIFNRMLTDGIEKVLSDKKLLKSLETVYNESED